MFNDSLFTIVAERGYIQGLSLSQPGFSFGGVSTLTCLSSEVEESLPETNTWLLHGPSSFVSQSEAAVSNPHIGNTFRLL